jgi:hypothetical protein
LIGFVDWVWDHADARRMCDTASFNDPGKSSVILGQTSGFLSYDGRVMLLNASIFNRITGLSGSTGSVNTAMVTVFMNMKWANS